MTVCTVLSHIWLYVLYCHMYRLFLENHSPHAPHVLPACTVMGSWSTHTVQCRPMMQCRPFYVCTSTVHMYCTTFFINKINFKMERRERKLQHMSYLLLIINNTLSLVRDIFWTILCIQSRDEAAWGRSGRFCVLSWSCYCCILKRRYLKKVVTTKTILVQTGTISIIRH